jgi:hypothetical protein
MHIHRHYAFISAFYADLAEIYNKKVPSINEFELKNAAGETTTIPKAKATIIVNTASACGYTKHYAGLQVCMLMYIMYSTCLT